MKKDRNMYYQNYQTGGFINPQPSGFQQNMSYSTFGPNAYPNYQQYDEFDMNDNNYESRISRLERQIRKIDTRISKLESINDTLSDEIVNDNYMI